MRLLGALLVLISFNAFAAGSDQQSGQQSNWQKVGSGTHKIVLVPVYTATLYTKDGTYKPTEPVKLVVEYKISAGADKLANRTIDEMRATNCKHTDKYDSWLKQMNTVFPDVKDGVVVTGIKENDTSTFFTNSKKSGEIKGKDFQDCFFGVWLKESTSAPKLRRALLGL